MNIALFVIVYIAAVFVLLKPWSRHSHRSKPKKYSPVNLFGAVSLACESESCQETAATDGRRFLVDEAPEVPLQQCPAETCGCRYVHHEDRRSRSDQRVIKRRAEHGKGSDRRTLRGRRKSDWSLLAVSG